MGLATYTVIAHIPSDIPVHNQIIRAKKLKSQENLNVINEWTKKKKIKLNLKKTKNMIFNFSRNYQFITKLAVDNENLDVVKETKLLVTIITDDLKWAKNTKEIVKKSYQRMQLLNAAASFTSNSKLKKSLSHLC